MEKLYRKLIDIFIFDILIAEGGGPWTLDGAYWAKKVFHMCVYFYFYFYFYFLGYKIEFLLLSLPSYLTSIYTCRVTTTEKVCGISYVLITWKCIKVGCFSMSDGVHNKCMRELLKKKKKLSVWKWDIYRIYDETRTKKKKKMNTSHAHTK